MNIKEARAAIEAILAAIEDDELPEFDKVEINEQRGEVLVWWGGSGRVLGSARSAEGRDPLVYRHDASWHAIQLEMTYRADKRYLENGDDHKGIRLGRRKVKVGA